MKKIVLMVFVAALSLGQRAVAQSPLEVTALAGLLHIDSAGEIQGTTQTLHFGESPSAALLLNFYWSDYFSTELGVTFSRPRISVRSGTEEVKGKRLLFAEPDILFRYHFSPGASIEPYIGAGAMYLTFRRAKQDIAIDGVTVQRIEQPDHMALLLDAGVKIPATPGLSFVLDARYGPAQSTAEVYESDTPGHTRQSNYHPLVVAAGISYRF